MAQPDAKDTEDKACTVKWSVQPPLAELGH